MKTSSSTSSSPRLSAYLAALLASVSMLALSPVQAAAPIDRSTLQAAEGGYVLADGRTLNLRVLSRSVEVNMNEESVERWRAESESVLISPDRRHRLHLHRSSNGTVDRVSLESPRGL